MVEALARAISTRFEARLGSVARKHATRLRQLALLAGFIVPALLPAFALFVPPALAVPAMVLSVSATIIGMFTERWHFFAEAQHVVTLYYGVSEA